MNAKWGILCPLGGEVYLTKQKEILIHFIPATLSHISCVYFRKESL